MNIYQGEACGMAIIEELRAREEEVEREWQWLHETISLVAQARAGQEELQAFRLMQEQCMAVGERRVELRLAMERAKPSFTTS